jgi:mono/diheme cytochrome c family protein
MKFCSINLTKAMVLLAAVVGPASYFLFTSSPSDRVEAQRGGAAVYSQHCARCHGADGRAQTAKGRQTDAVDLTSDDWTPDTGHDTRLITNGKGSMPSFRKKLTPAQISSVAQYIRRFKR